jgi:2-amino-4-hydroxy-6-hydroxymethyldihydropteridine diphosphokinase
MNRMRKESGRVEENVFISLGSNLGDKEENLRRASQSLAALPGIKVTGKSGIVLTRPVGLTGQPDFLNQVQRLSTGLSPEELLGYLLDIEKEMGRVRTVRWGPRVIDLDILFYGTVILSLPTLVLPHPEIRNRPFFMEMIREIDPAFLSRWEGMSNSRGKEARWK